MNQDDPPPAGSDSNEAPASGADTPDTTPEPPGPFGTEHLLPDLRGRSIRGGALALSSQAGRLGLQLIAMVVLARLLTPEEFGRVAMVTVITGFVTLFKDLGLSLAVVQRPKITHAQISALFWINVAVSGVLMLLTMAAAPLIAAFYGDEQLVPITIALATTLLVSGLGVQHFALLQRQMRFRTIAIITVVSMAIGVLGSIVAAYYGAGHWALVLLLGLPVVATTVLSWLAESWRPSRPARAAGVRSMLGFGGYLAAFGVVNHFARKADDVLIGWALGARSLGLYSRAYQLLTLPISQLNGPMTGIAAPALSRLTDDPVRFRNYFRRALGGLTNLGIPLVLFCVAAAEPLVLLAFGDQWQESVDLFRALGPAALVGTANVAVAWVCIPLGRTKRMFQWALIAIPIVVTGFAVGVRYGTMGVAVAASVVHPLSWLGGCLFCFPGTPVRVGDALGVMWRPLVASGVASALLYAALPTATNDLDRALGLLVGGVGFALVHAVVLRGLPGGRAAWREGFALLRSLFRRDR